MRLPGYCTECHRIKQVTVSSGGLARMAARGTAMGICAECAEPKCVVCRKRSRDPIHQNPRHPEGHEFRNR